MYNDSMSVCIKCIEARLYHDGRDGHSVLRLMDLLSPFSGHGPALQDWQVFLILRLNHGWCLDSPALEEVKTFATLYTS
jgi:hypothetical protein